jgi:hypothetical protein
MDLLVELDPTSSPTHAVHWETVGPIGDPLADGVEGAASARLTKGRMATLPGAWAIRSAVASPIADSVQLDRVLLLSAYRPHDLDAMLDFDRRITRRYTHFWAAFGEKYAGTVLCDAWIPGWLAEIHWYEATTIDHAESMLAGVVMPDDVEAIVNECRDLQDRSRTRHNIWFEPLRR